MTCLRWLAGALGAALLAGGGFLLLRPGPEETAWVIQEGTTCERMAASSTPEGATSLLPSPPPGHHPSFPPPGTEPLPGTVAGTARGPSFYRGEAQPVVSATLLDARIPGISPRDIPPRYADDPEGYAALLERIKERDAATTDERAQPLLFTALLPDPDLGPLAASAGTPERFTPATGRVYALLDCREGRARGVERMLVKWFQPGGRQVWFQVVGVLPELPWNWFWYEEPAWETGEWRVETYTLDDPPRLAAAGSYLVEEGVEFWGNAVVVTDPGEPWTRSDLSRKEPVYLRFPYRVSRDQPAAVTAVKTENGELHFDRDIPLDHGEEESVTLLCDPAAPFPPGTYRVEVRSGDGTVRGRVGFVLN